MSFAANPIRRRSCCWRQGVRSSETTTPRRAGLLVSPTLHHGSHGRHASQGPVARFKPRHALIAEEFSRWRQFGGAFESADVEVRFVGKLRVATRQRRTAAGAEAA